MRSLGVGLIWREAGRGPLRLFMLALALSVASMLSVTLVADRLDQALKVSGRDYIAADRILSVMQDTQHNPIQADRMASLGPLVAGVPHEINPLAWAGYGHGQTSTQSA